MAIDTEGRRNLGRISHLCGKLDGMRYSLRRCFMAFSVAAMWILGNTAGLYAQDASVLQAYLERQDTTAFGSVLWSCVIMAGDGRVMAEVNADAQLVPASAMKLAVTFPAWKILGPDFRFETVFEYDGHLHDSILDGSLYIRGGGDPTLGSGRFPSHHAEAVAGQVLQMLRQAGIRRIEGGVIADADVFDQQLIPSSWIWEDMGNYYGGGVSGLNYHDNEIRVMFRPAAVPGAPAALLGIDPPVEGLDFENDVVTAASGSGDQVIIYGAPYDMHRWLTGSVPAGEASFTVRGSVPDPAYFCAQQIHKFLAVNNIDIQHPPVTVRQLRNRGITVSDARKSLGVLYSPALREIVELTNGKSINLYAEALLKTLGVKRGGAGTYAAGIRVVRDFWTGHGIDLSSASLLDGSGLSPSDRLSAGQLAGMMRLIVSDPSASDFLQTLNLAGHEGDMGRFLPDGPCKGNMRAKSGYMKSVRTFAGVIENMKHEKITFAVMVNHDGSDNDMIKRGLREILGKICAMGE